MSMKTVVKGEILHRTQLMTPAHAASFARMIEANAQYEQATVHHEPLAKGEKTHFVTFAPSAESRKEALRTLAQRQRSGRGERGKYTFIPDSDTFNIFWCLNEKTGMTYCVTLFDCDCPDFTYRCKSLNLRCKHQEALLHSMEEISTAKPVSRSAEASRSYSEDFTWEGLV